MTSDDRFGGTVSVWLEQRAGTGAPDYLDDILGRTARTRQRPGWTSIERWPPVDISANRTVLPSRFPTRTFAILVVLGLVLAIALAIVAVGSRPRLPEPFGPARNGALAYVADGDIYRLETASGVPSLIVGGPTDDHAPVFSHDGSKLLFRRSTAPNLEQVVVASADGSNPRPVTDDLAEIGSVDWSPDSSKIAVAHADVDGGALSIVDASGREPMRTLDIADLQPVELIAWRPEEGGSLFFTAESQAGSGRIGIYAVGQDGSTVRQVAPPLPGGGVYGSPSLSADGALLTYSNWEPNVSDGLVDGWSHVLDIATGGDHQVRLSDQDAEVNGQFSPDGSRIVFERQRIMPDGDWDRQIVVGPADGDAGREIVTIGPPFGNDEGLEYGFAFSPDGQQVVLTIGPTTQLYDATDGTRIGDPLSIAGLPTYQRTAP